MQASVIIFAVAASLVAAAPGHQSYVRWFQIEPANKIYATIIEQSWQTFKERHSYAWRPVLLVEEEPGKPKERTTDPRQATDKQYESSEEEAYRRSVFAENVKEIKIHNQKYKKGETSYWLGINNLADLNADEFKALYTGCIKMKVNQTEGRKITVRPANKEMLPDRIDWREKGLVTPVKDQGFCGSCWSFSATGALEGQYFRKTGRLLNLSEQQLVDCSTEFGNVGCFGGLMDAAFEYIKKYGIENATDYPYNGMFESCEYISSKIVTKIKGFSDIDKGNESALQEAVATIGPISVAVDASHRSFQLYAGGVYDEKECNSTQLDHAVLAVGYGTEDGKDYWIVKNSWGTKWGDNGYIKIVRNKGNMCGIATQSSYPVI